ncbi:Piso0_005366 [Millerozyma farinosa CBS 7064]|uniref:Piso0_005366 protein n=1 Tax=Pichia sorbitophila (strain ATCC MYA-4447 / BCRC 22081 / CBS 7064 / NBRC 10061 / NRRL Y-12695) TaxID=559304 RepID=G8Y1Z6_PICSO|nr:Piso0_005366 [Millerozyma farinosa CBS 7064]
MCPSARDPVHVPDDNPTFFAGRGAETQTTQSVTSARTAWASASRGHFGSVRAGRGLYLRYRRRPSGALPCDGRAKPHSASTWGPARLANWAAPVGAHAIPVRVRCQTWRRADAPTGRLACRPGRFSVLPSPQRLQVTTQYGSASAPSTAIRMLRCPLAPM